MTNISLSISMNGIEEFIHNFDKSSTVQDVKHFIDTVYFLDSNLFYLWMRERPRGDYEVLEDIFNDDTGEVDVCLRVHGGTTRYKKSSSAMRWKWKLKRMRRLQRKRRQMRRRAR